MGAGVSAVESTLFEQLQKEALRDDTKEEILDTAAEVKRLRGLLREAYSKLQAAPLVQHEKDLGPAPWEEDRSEGLEEKENKLEDGTAIFVRSDGYKRQVETSGITIETWPSGHRLQCHPNGRRQETFPNGTKKTFTEDGKTIVKRRDGSKWQENADKSTIGVSADGVVEQFNPETKIRIIKEVDGTTLQTNEETNETIQVFSDGTKIDTDADGVRIVSYPDGYKIQRNPNGTVIESWKANGRKVQTKADGCRLEVLPDGRKIQTSPNGEVLEQFPDGTTKKMKGSHLCVQCNACQTIISIDRETFVTSCRVCRNIMLTRNVKVSTGPDGKISATPNLRTEKQIEEDILEIFRHYDINGSNSVEPTELTRFLTDLSFPSDQFDDLFRECDLNGNKTLEWEEFLPFFKKLQEEIAAKSQAPVLQMMNDILAEQKKKLEQEQQALEEQRRKLEERAQQGDQSATKAMEDNSAVLDKLKDEYEAKTRQLKLATDAKRKRQRDFLEKRKQERLARLSEEN